MIFLNSTATQGWTYLTHAFMTSRINFRVFHSDITTWNPVKHQIAPHNRQLRAGTDHQIAPNWSKEPQNNPLAIMELEQENGQALVGAGRLRHPWSLPTHPGLLSQCKLIWMDASGIKWLQGKATDGNGWCKQCRILPHPANVPTKRAASKDVIDLFLSILGPTLEQKKKGDISSHFHWTGAPTRTSLMPHLLRNTQKTHAGCDPLD